jgi:drug/metabolite transporter (DMT)-like permease
MYEILTLLSEVVLSSYPILIKKIPATVSLQTGIRMITFTVLAALAGVATGTPILAGSTVANVLGPGILNLLHVGSSYSAFEALPAGNAMSIFYTYPVLNMLGAALAFKETIPAESLPWMGLAVVGAFLLSQPTKSNWTLFGVVAAFVAAATETGIYLWFRKTGAEEKDPQPWPTMARMYGGSTILWGLGILLGVLAIGRFGGSSAISSMVLFNSLIGFVGYALRFFTIPYVSTVAFSSISFFGIVAAYLLGWLFVGEVPSLLQGAGAACIIIANAFLLRKEIV